MCIPTIHSIISVEPLNIYIKKVGPTFESTSDFLSFQEINSISNPLTTFSPPALQYQSHPPPSPPSPAPTPPICVTTADDVRSAAAAAAADCGVSSIHTGEEKRTKAKRPSCSHVEHLAPAVNYTLCWRKSKQQRQQRRRWLGRKPAATGLCWDVAGRRSRNSCVCRLESH